MDDIRINIKEPLFKAFSKDNIEIYSIPEPEDVIRERKFRRSVKSEVKSRLEKLIAQRLKELEPVIKKEKDAEFQRGYELGIKDGQQAELKQIAPLKEKLWNTVQEVVDYKIKVLKEAESTIAKMAFNFAGSIIKDEVKASPELIINQVRKALEYVISEGKLTFHVNPDDISQFDDKEKFIPEEYLERIIIMPDENINRGGCVLKTNSGDIDATIETQIEELKAAINNGLENEPEQDV